MLLSPIKISPFARRLSGGLTLQQIIDAFGFSNAWSSENLTIAGTTTTALDYKGVHNLANPAATNNPTFNASSIIFGGKPSLSFNGIDDYLIKNISSFNNVNSGFQIDVFKSNSPISLTTADTANNAKKLSGYINTGKIGFWYYGGTQNLITANTLTFNSLAGNAVAFSSNGTNYVISLNGSANSGGGLNILTGADDGKWFNDITGRDNICIGSAQQLSPIYGVLEWVFSGVGTNTSETDLNALTLALKNYYKL